MILDRVTITGADDSVTPEELGLLSNEFPFIEWGILVSADRSGAPRYPSTHWVLRLAEIARGSRMQLSLHVCGRWARAILRGQRDMFIDWMPAWTVGGPGHVFKRIQLNVRAADHELAVAAAATYIRHRFLGQQFIVQMNGTDENEVVLSGLRQQGVDAVPLFDRSGGAGVSPEAWPRPLTGVPYHGYAGGLGPETLPHELARIEKAARIEIGSDVERMQDDMPLVDVPIWIDMESGVRSGDTLERFDRGRARDVLELCRPRVENG